MKQALRIAALVLFGVLPIQGANADIAVSLSSPGGEYSGSLYTLGFEFSVSANTAITALGAYDSGQDGFNGQVNVGLWDTSGNLLTSTVLAAGTGATLINDFRFGSITPFNLVAGQHYVVGAFEPSDLATSLNTGQGGSGSINPLVTIYEDRFSNFNSAFSFPDSTNFHPDGSWLGGNFEFGSAVPEPATWGMLLIGFACLGFLGYKRSARREALAS